LAADATVGNTLDDIADTLIASGDLPSGQDLSADTGGGANTIDDISTALDTEGTDISGQDLSADAGAGNTVDDISTVLAQDVAAEEPPPVEEEPAVEEPTVPEDTTTKPLVVTAKKPKTTADSTYLLGTVLQQPSSLAQSLTSYRGAGELESKTTGKPRKNVWNEASLRLKDALGL